MKIRIRGCWFLAVACLLAQAEAHAGCALVQTASNEITIRSSVGGCDTTALREGLQGALGSGTAVTSAGGASPTSLADVKRSSGQSALWRLAVINSQAPITSLSMPGRAP